MWCVAWVPAVAFVAQFFYYRALFNQMLPEYLVARERSFLAHYASEFLGALVGYSIALTAKIASVGQSGKQVFHYPWRLDCGVNFLAFWTSRFFFYFFSNAWLTKHLFTTFAQFCLSALGYRFAHKADE